MSGMSNPFKFDEPVVGSDFVDRAEELDGLKALMRNGRNAIVVSPRRYGKSSLLYEAARLVRKEGVRVGIADLMGAGTEHLVAQKLADAALKVPSGPFAGWAQKLTDRLARTRAGISVTVSSDGLKFAAEPAEAAKVPWSTVIEEVLRVLKDASKKEQVCLVVDEFQKVAEVNPALPGVFKSMSNELRGVSLVLAGSRYHVMLGLAQGALQRVGTEIGLGLIPERLLARHLRDRSARAGKPMTEDAAAEILLLGEGIPSDVQHLAFWSFEAAVTQVDRAAVGRGLESILRKGAAVWDGQMEELGPAQRAVMRALAVGTTTSPYSTEFKAASGLTHNLSIKKALAVLQDKEFIERSPAGMYRISEPFRRIWLAKVQGVDI